MARSIEARVTNTVPDAARDAQKALRAELGDALADTAHEIVRGAQRRVPVRTGDARASMKVEEADDGARIVAGGVRAPYFHILEYGSKFVRGGHHLGKAAEAAVEDLERAALEGIKEAVRRGGFDVG